jgi:hypothetical protein
MLAEVLVAFWLFELVIFVFSFWVVLERIVVGWAVVSVEVSGTWPVKSTSGSGGLHVRAKCLPAQVAHRVPADAGQLVTARRLDEREAAARTGSLDCCSSCSLDGGSKVK